MSLHFIFNLFSVYLFSLAFFFSSDSYAGRPPAASTATGNKHHHISEQEDLINKALV